MNSKLHYYGTRQAAIIAGRSAKEADIIALSAYYIDLFNKKTRLNNGEEVEATTQYDAQVMWNRIGRNKSSIRSWFVFHFPGVMTGRGDEWFITRRYGNNHHLDRFFRNLNFNKGDMKPYLEGVAAHVVCDSFAHEGFLGIESDYNKVEIYDTIILDKVKKFKNKHGIRSNLVSKILSPILSLASDNLGHAGVGNCIDHPGELEFKFTYDSENRSNFITRNNTITLIRALEATIHMLGGVCSEEEALRYTVSNSYYYKDIESDLDTESEFYSQELFYKAVQYYRDEFLNYATTDACMLNKWRTLI